MSDVNSIAEKEGWARAVDHWIAETHPLDGAFYREYACSEERANWRYLLSLTPACRVLDIGSGLGATACGLARVVGSVTAVDATIENLRFVRLRCLQEGITNVRCINTDLVQLPQLPFADDCFDLAAMIGLLGWTGDAKTEQSPMKTQREVLARVRRVLKPEGKLYLAIENRFGATYLTGKPDEHTGLRFVTVLPRALADLYSRISRNRPYRTYTHSIHRLKRLLHSCGFKSTRFFFPAWHYAAPRYYVSLDTSQGLDFLLNSLLAGHPRLSSPARAIATAAVRLGLHRAFSPAFAVIAGN